MGWYGVHHATNTGAARVVPFFLRRFFRIAPAYYAAAWLYYELAPPVGGFDVTQLIASLGFVNAWSPQLMSTVVDGWNVVPGGWSIGVEVTFYVVFPLFAALVTSLRQGIILCGLCLIAGFAANRIAAAILVKFYDPVAIDNFLYFWFPDQMIVFALGGVIYFARRWITAAEGTSFAGHLSRHGNTLAALALALFFACAYLNLPHWTGLAPPYFPQFIVVSLCLGAFVLALSQARSGVFINPLATALGKVSFSAYLLHFAVIRLTVARYPSAFHADSVGVGAIVAFAAVWVVVVALTSAVAWGSYRTLELPMMTLGGKLARFSQGGGVNLQVGRLVEAPITSVTTKQ